MKAPPLICACCAALVVLARAPATLSARSAHSDSLSFPRKFWELEARGNVALGTAARPQLVVNEAVRELGGVWRLCLILHKEPPRGRYCTPTSHSDSAGRRQRTRRHIPTAPRPHVHGQLMRVGCVLGTCQVQNLSHRLYQLIGQRGKEDSAPVNPKSPHSYG